MFVLCLINLTELKSGVGYFPDSNCRITQIWRDNFLQDQIGEPELEVSKIAKAFVCLELVFVQNRIYRFLLMFTVSESGSANTKA